MYPIDWAVALLSPTQWLVVLIVLSIVSAVACSLWLSDEGAGSAFVGGLLLPLTLGICAVAVLHFISFLVWLWIGAPS